MNSEWPSRYVFRALVCSALLLCFRGVVFSEQGGPAAENPPLVEGKVRDGQGAAIPGVAVHLEPAGAAPGASAVSATSDAQGHYILHASPGPYSLRAAKAGFRTLLVKEVALAAGSQQHINLTLQPGDSGQVVVDDAKRLRPTEPSPVSPLEFADTPNFSVAGVTDYSNVGLHGSDAKVRTSDALAKDTAALKGSAEESAATSAAGEPHRKLGDEKEKNGDPVGAVNEYETAVKLDPSEENYFAWGAELLLHRAGIAAVQVFSKGGAAYPKSSRMRAGLGAAYYANGQYGEAASEMCQASDLDPSNSEPYLFLGEMEKAAADPLPCSEEKLARFADQQPESAQANFYYGLVLWKKARRTQNAAGFSGAESYFRKAAELDPQSGEVQLQLGLLYNGRGQRDRARAAFEKAVSATPSLSAAHYQLSLSYRRAGDAAKADQEMKIYEELRRSEDAQLERERRELRQFVTVLKGSKPTQ